jgi:hypothetical protein
MQVLFVSCSPLHLSAGGEGGLISFFELGLGAEPLERVVDNLEHLLGFILNLKSAEA